MSDSEHVKIKRLIIETFNKWEHLTNEEWFAACALGHVSGDNLDDEIQSHIDRRMIAGAAEIKRLREERDEARREVCKARAAISRNSWAAQAKKAGWDNLWEET